MSLPSLSLFSLVSYLHLPSKNGALPHRHDIRPKDDSSGTPLCFLPLAPGEDPGGRASNSKQGTETEAKTVSTFDSSISSSKAFSTHLQTISLSPDH